MMRITDTILLRHIALLRHITLASLVASALALSACGGSAEGDGSTLIFSSSDSGNGSGNGESVEIQPLTRDDLYDLDLDGELGCSFATNAVSDPLLVASGYVGADESHAEMVIKYGGSLVVGMSTEAGGFDAIIDGSSFDTAGMIVDIARTSDEPAGAGESPPYPALLRTIQPDVGERLIEGFWTCGP